MASSHATAETDRRPALVVVGSPVEVQPPTTLQRFGAWALDRLTLRLARSRTRAELGSLRATTEVGRETGVRC